MTLHGLVQLDDVGVVVIPSFLSRIRGHKPLAISYCQISRIVLREPAGLRCGLLEIQRANVEPPVTLRFGQARLSEMRRVHTQTWARVIEARRPHGDP